MASSARWLDVVRHQVKGFQAPYLLVVQHHDIPTATLLVAPVTPPLRGDVDVLAPPLSIDGMELRVRLLDMSAVPRAMLGDTVMSASSESQRISDAIDIILYGYPVGRRA